MSKDYIAHGLRRKMEHGHLRINCEHLVGTANCQKRLLKSFVPSLGKAAGLPMMQVK